MTHHNDSNTAAKLEILVADYAEAREDERHYVTSQGTILTLALTSISLLGALAVIRWRGDPGNPKVPDFVVAGAPMIVMAILAHAEAAGAQAVLRSFYMRALEREIRKVAQLDQDMAAYPGLRALSLVEIMATYSALSAVGEKGGSTFYRSMTTLIIFSAFLMFGGLVFSLSLTVSPFWRVAMFLVYGLIAAILVADNLYINLNGRRFFEREITVTTSRMSRGLLPHQAFPEQFGRSLKSYLLLPRPDDLLKILFVVIGVWFGWLATRTDAALRDGVRPMEVAIFVFALEFLVYQSRYQWNDIRGVYEDEASPNAIGRGRLPGGRGSISASLLVMLVRVLLTVMLAFVARGQDRHLTHIDLVLLSSLLLVYLIALLYEVVRDGPRRSGTCSTRALVATLVVVGLGYPLRFSLGWTAMGSTLSMPLVPALVAIWGLGVAFVSLTWTLEAGSYVTSMARANNHVFYFTGLSEGDAQNPEDSFKHRPISTKPHLRTLFRLSGFRLDESVPSRTEKTPISGADVKWIEDAPRRSFSIWNIGFAVYAIGYGLAAPELVNEPRLCIWPAALTAAAALLVLARLASVQVGTGVTSGLLLSTSVVSCLRIDATWAATGSLAMASLLPAVIAVLFAGQVYRNTRGVVIRVARQVIRATGAAGAWLLGKDPRERGQVASDQTGLHQNAIRRSLALRNLSV